MAKKEVRYKHLTEEEWDKEAYALARRFIPPIEPCNRCGHPFVRGWACTFCGESNPENIDDDMNKCHADCDGDCEWEFCPQIRDGEPKKSGRSCPLRINYEED